MPALKNVSGCSKVRLDRRIRNTDSNIHDVHRTDEPASRHDLTVASNLHVVIVENSRTSADGSLPDGEQLVASVGHVPDVVKDR